MIVSLYFMTYWKVVSSYLFVELWWWSTFLQGIPLHTFCYSETSSPDLRLPELSTKQNKWKVLLAHLGLEPHSQLVTQKEAGYKGFRQLQADVISVQTFWSLHKNTSCFLPPLACLISALTSVTYCSCLKLENGSSVSALYWQVQCEHQNQYCDIQQPQECCFSGAHYLFNISHSPLCIAVMLHWATTLHSTLQLWSCFINTSLKQEKQCDVMNTYLCSYSD